LTVGTPGGRVAVERDANVGFGVGGGVEAGVVEGGGRAVAEGEVLGTEGAFGGCLVGGEGGGYVVPGLGGGEGE